MQNKKEKKTRLEILRMIVSSQQLENQEDLLVELDKAGYPCGQATLSRDLHQLRISKVRMMNGRSVYALSREGQFVPAPSLAETNKGKWAVNFSGNLMVIHTPPGHASMVAYHLDNAHTTLILGTVAGDDTVLAVLREDAEREEVFRLIEEKVPEMKSSSI